jgi:surface antigen
MITALRRGKKLVSFKIETGVILGTIVVLLILPSAAVASMTNISDMLKNDVSPGDSGSNGTFYTGNSPEDNTYAWGNCTYWVFIKRKEAGDPIPNAWGNAADWALHARLEGYKVDQKPTVGSIMQTADSAGGLGHVAYVTKVDPITGSWTISEMNVKGLNVVSERMLTILDAHKYNFIHDKEQ